MEQDDYLLFHLLDDGEAHTITYSGKTYTFQFMGERIGSENYLSVKASSGEEKRFGWGWGYEEVWRALDHLKKGWDTPQVPRYETYDEKDENRGEQVFLDVKQDY